MCECFVFSVLLMRLCHYIITIALLFFTHFRLIMADTT